MPQQYFSGTARKSGYLFMKPPSITERRVGFWRMNSPAFNADRSCVSAESFLPSQRAVLRWTGGDSQSVSDEVRPGENEGQWPFLHLLWRHAFFVYSLSKVVIKVFLISNTLQIGDRSYREAHENYNISRVHFILWEFHTTPFDHVLLPQCLPDSPPHWYPLNFMFSFFF